MGIDDKAESVNNIKEKSRTKLSEEEDGDGDDDGGIWALECMRGMDQ